MARWGQTSLSKDALRTAMATFRPDLYDAALGKGARSAPPAPGAFAAFAGPAFDPEDIPGYLASFDVAKRA
jgi:NitT/TauT family transport system ATP-binding protein